MFTPFAFRTQFIQNETPSEIPGGNVGPEVDPDATAFLTAAGITDPTISGAINQLVLDLKSAGIWTKMKAVYPFVGGTGPTHKWNLINPQDSNAAFRLNYGGTVTHSSNGIQGDGSSGFYNTFCPASTMGANDFFMGVYIRTNAAEDRVDIGALNTTGTNTGVQIGSRRTSNDIATRCNNSTGTIQSTANTDSRGFFAISRLSSTQYTVSKNKTHSTKTVNSNTATTRNILGLCFNLNGLPGFYSTRQQALSAIGEGLTTSEIDDFVDANQTFQTTLGRFV